MVENRPKTGFSPTLIGSRNPSESFRTARAQATSSVAPSVPNTADVRLLWMELKGEDAMAQLERLDLAEQGELGDNAMLLDCAANPEDPAVVWLGKGLASLCDADTNAGRLSDFSSECLLASLGGTAAQAMAQGRPIRLSGQMQGATGAPSLFYARFLPIASRGETPDHVLAIITASAEKGAQPMDRQDPGEEILELDNEIMIDTDIGGEDAFVSEPGVLLLDDELPAEPLVRKIDVKPRLRRETREDARARATAAGGEKRTGWRAPLNARRKSLARPGSTEEGQGQDMSAGTGTDEQLPSLNLPSSSLERSLEDARVAAEGYSDAEARTRGALYQALGRAYDFALDAEASGSEFAAMLEAAGIEQQERAPFTPVVKLVFGTEYDKTRLAEFASVIGWCKRKSVTRGNAADFIAGMPGGVKRIVEMERLSRRGEDSGPAERIVPSRAIARKLGAIDPIELSAIDDDGDEFMLVVARRMPGGRIGVLGEVPRDVSMLEKAARRLLSEQTRSRKRATQD